ncbi:hypothetical protein BJY04DRAFT_198975 [Aspergillus karnatakaensis]|uniref:uncharacterized protein n=1 Tax=Aspergillus karnatakaensis TaxID=1810916 RepID=UPI003CCD7760
MTSDERRCFTHFQFHTAPTLLEFFDSALWQNLVLQLSQSEPPVYHAIIALSAIHENSEANGMPLATNRADNPWYQFAEDQLARSIKLINQHHTSQDPRLREVILVCCLLFVLADLLRGLYENAFVHLRSGLRILKDLQSTSVSSTIDVDCILAAFSQLDISAAHYDRNFPILLADDQHSTKPHFQTLNEARIAFDAVIGAVYDFSAPCAGMTEEQVQANYPTLQTRQHAVWGQLTQFKTSFQEFYQTSYHTLSLKEQRGAEIISLRLISLPVCLQTCLLSKNNPTRAHYTPDLDRVCTMAERIMNMFPSPDRPSFTVEVGVIPPLHLAARACADYGVRWRAIQLLRSWPHREGPFDSNWLASLSEEALRLDLQSQCIENPEFGATTFIVSGEVISAADMLQRLTTHREEKIDMLLRTKRLDRIPDTGECDPLAAVGPVKGMASWSCIRAFKAGKYSHRDATAVATAAAMNTSL